MIDTQYNDVLPCFHYILTQIKEDDDTTPAAFAIAYLHYLEHCEITEVDMIVKQFRKISLMAQFNRTGRSTPIDFFKIKDQTYTLKSADDLRRYREDLFKVCKDPKSFSMLYGKCDPKHHICKFCPMSEHYTQKYLKEEYALAKYALVDARHFYSIITCMDDIDRLFHTYNELYQILNNITRPYTFPGLKCLFTAVRMKTDAYFNALLNIQDYSYIRKEFIKELKDYGITSKTENIAENYDDLIYNYLLEQLAGAPDLTQEQAFEYRDMLFHRKAYVPIFDADGIPSVTLATPIPDKPKSKKSSKRKKKMDTYKMSSAITRGMDKEMGLDNNGHSLDTPLNEYSVAGAIETDPAAKITVPDSDIEVPVEKIEKESLDIFSSTGDIVVEHSAEDSDGIFGYEDDDFEFTDEDFIDDSFDEEDETKSVEKPGENMAYNSGDETNEETLLPPTEHEMFDDYSEVTDSLNSSALESICGENTLDLDNEVVNDVNVTGNNSYVETDKSTISVVTQHSYDDLLLPIALKENYLFEIEDVLDNSQVDRIISYSLLNGCCVMEPAVTEKTNEECLLLYVKNSLYRLSFQNEYIKKILSNHRYKIGSVRLLALYALFRKNGIEIHRTDCFVPMDILMCKGNVSFLEMSLASQFSTTFSTLKDTYIKENKFQLTEPLLHSMLLYGAYGNSLYRSYIICEDNVYGASFSYDSEMKLEPKSFDYNKNVARRSGVVLYFNYASDTQSKGIYEQLTRNVILRIAEKACFLKFNLMLLHYTAHSITVYVDDYCQDYIYNILLMHLFKEGNQLKIYPLNISLKKTILSETE